MTTGVSRETATIIPFPLKNRMATVVQSRNSRLVEEAKAMPLRDYDSWYHEEAIAESTEGRKPQA